MTAALEPSLEEFAADVGSTGPVTSTSSAAAASVGNPAWMYASTATRHSLSIISTAAGTMPAAMIPLTVAAPSSTVAKSNSIVVTAGAFWVSRTHTSVAIPSMPSLPTNTPRRS